MVHALREVQRVLKPRCLLIDIRPGVVHRQVGIRNAGRLRKIGTTRETFELDRTADKAISLAVGEGRFQLEERIQFECNRVLDTIGEFQNWLSEFGQPERRPSHNLLLRRVEHAFSQARGRRWIVVRGPLVMRVLRSQELSTCRHLTTHECRRGFRRRGNAHLPDMVKGIE